MKNTIKRFLVLLLCVTLFMGDSATNVWCTDIFDSNEIARDDELFEPSNNVNEDTNTLEEINEELNYSDETAEVLSSDEEELSDKGEEFSSEQLNGSAKPYDTATYSLTYTVYEGKATITGYEGTASGDLIIPDTIAGCPVTVIKDHAFIGCSEFNGKLIIGKNVTSIGEFAFQSCSGLTGDLIIPDSVTSIGEYAFSYCSGLTGTLGISAKMTSINEGVFWLCGFTGNLIIPDSVTSIGDHAFDQCSGFTGSLLIPNSVSFVGSYAFLDCTGFTSISVPGECVQVGQPFEDCTENILYRDRLTGTYSLKYAVTNNEAALIGYAGEPSGSLVIPDKVAEYPVTSIAPWALFGCDGFNGSLTIGNNVKSIGEYAFTFCSGFIDNLEIPSSVTSIGQSAFSGCSGFTGKLIMPDGITSIEDHTFSGCSGFEGSLEIPSSVTSIGQTAFSGCSGFTGELIIPDDIASIGDYTFSGCIGFKGSLEIPEGITSIGKDPFSGCSGFTRTENNSSCSVLLPTDWYSTHYWIDEVTGNEVTSISHGVAIRDDYVEPEFEYSVSDEKVTITGYIKTPSGNLVIPDSIDGYPVTEIADRAFYGKDGFTGRLTIGKNVTYIGSLAFWGCSGLQGDLIIPDNVTSIQNNAFGNCSGISQISVPGNCLQVGNTFLNCEDKVIYRDRAANTYTLKYTVSNNEATITGYAGKPTGELIIPETIDDYPITSIGAEAFDSCKGFNGVLIIPDSVTSISANAFGNNNFDTVLIPSDCDVDSMAFYEGSAQSYDKEASTVHFFTDLEKEGTYVEKTEYQKNLFKHIPYGELPNVAIPGKSFLGWYTDKTGGEKVSSDKIIEVPGNINLYARYESKYKVATPSIYDESGVISGDSVVVRKGTKVTISCATNGINIFYTTDGTEPNPEKVVSGNESGTHLYEDAIVISKNIDLKVIAVKNGYSLSESVIKSFTIKDESNVWGDITPADRVEFSNADAVPSSLWLSGISDVDYTGSAITFPDISVYKGKDRLKKDTDYSIKYSNNIKAGTASVTITGKGNYSGSITKFFKIYPLSLGADGWNDSNLMIQDVTFAPSKGAQKGTTTASYMINGKAVTLKAGTDFTYSYSPEYDYKSSGEHYVTIMGKGNYSGTATFKETISSDVKLIQKMKFSKVANVPADREGDERTPDVSIMDGTYELQKGIDYELTYQNNCTPGTATIIVTGKGNYSGYKVVTFKITAIAISKAVLTTPLSTMTYTGEATSQTGYVLSYTAKKGETPEILVEGIDYTVSYSNEINAGKNKASIIFKGINRFTGTLKKNYTITPHTITDADVIPLEIGEVNYQKGKTIPTISILIDGRELIEKKDYTVSVSNNTSINDGTNAKKVPTITITGKGNYSGKVIKKFTINGSSIEDAKITATDIVYQNKSGICKPTIALYDSNGAKLAAGTDYDKNIVYKYAKDTTVSRVLDAKKKTYSEVERFEGDLVDSKDIIPVGAEIEATVTGIKNYAGNNSKRSVVFRYVTADISKASVKIVKQYYSGHPITLSKDDITITLNKQPMAKTDYEIVGYTKNIAKGTATVTLKGLGNYGGTKNVNFTITNKSMLFTISYDSNDLYMSTARPNAPTATGSMKDSNTAAGSKLAKNGFARKGYVFTGWNTKPDGSGQSYTNQEAFQVKESEYQVFAYGTPLVLYAQWNYAQSQGIVPDAQIRTYASGTNPEVGRSVITPSRPESNGYSYANFGRYNDYASNNGLDGEKIYLKGRVEVMIPTNKDSYSIAGKTITMYGIGIIITDEDGYQWVVNAVANSSRFKAMQKDLLGKEVTLYGTYVGYSGVLLMPAMDWDTFVTDTKEIPSDYYYL